MLPSSNLRNNTNKPNGFRNLKCLSLVFTTEDFATKGGDGEEGLHNCTAIAYLYRKRSCRKMLGCVNNPDLLGCSRSSSADLEGPWRHRRYPPLPVCLNTVKWDLLLWAEPEPFFVTGKISSSNLTFPCFSKEVAWKRSDLPDTLLIFLKYMI